MCINLILAFVLLQFPLDLLTSEPIQRSGGPRPQLGTFRAHSVCHDPLSGSENVILVFNRQRRLWWQSE